MKRSSPNMCGSPPPHPGEVVDGVNQDWLVVDRIVASRKRVASEGDVEGTEFLVKWKQMGYDMCRCDKCDDVQVGYDMVCRWECVIWKWRES